MNEVEAEYEIEYDMFMANYTDHSELVQRRLEMSLGYSFGKGIAFSGVGTLLT